MPSLIEILLATFAVYRLARMLALEDGAFDLFLRLRNRIDPEQLTWIGRGLNCPLCIGFWIALAAALLLAHQNATMLLSETILTWLGLAGLQTALHLWLERE